MNIIEIIFFSKKKERRKTLAARCQNYYSIRDLRFAIYIIILYNIELNANSAFSNLEFNLSN